MNLTTKQKVLAGRVGVALVILVVGTVGTSMFLNSEKQVPPTVLLEEKIAEPPKMDRVNLPTLSDTQELGEVDNAKADRFWMEQARIDAAPTTAAPTASEIESAKKRGVIEDEPMKKQVQYFQEIYDDQELGMVIVQNSGNNRNLLVRLSDAKTGKLMAQIHCPQYDMAKAMVPVGSYAVEIEQGIRWYGNKYGFAKRSVIEEVDVVVEVRSIAEGREAYLEFNSDTVVGGNPNARDPFSEMYDNMTAAKSKK